MRDSNRSRLGRGSRKAALPLLGLAVIWVGVATSLPTVLTTLAAGLVVGVLPGYLLLRIRRTSPWPDGAIVVLTVPVSAAITALWCLLLDVTVGLHRTGILVCETVTVVALVAARLIMDTADAADTDVPITGAAAVIAPRAAYRRLTRPDWTWSYLFQWLVVVAGTGLGIAALAVGIVRASRVRMYVKFTSLTLSSPKPTGTGAYTIVVAASNNSGRQQSYVVRVRLGNHGATSHFLRLAPGQTWRHDVTASCHSAVQVTVTDRRGDEPLTAIQRPTCTGD
jgi:uncharacterized membrane protein